MDAITNQLENKKEIHSWESNVIAVHVTRKQCDCCLWYQKISTIFLTHQMFTSSLFSFAISHAIEPFSFVGGAIRQIKWHFLNSLMNKSCRSWCYWFLCAKWGLRDRVFVVEFHGWFIFLINWHFRFICGCSNFRFILNLLFAAVLSHM